MIQIQERVSLAPYTTMGLGGEARYFAEAKSVEELQELFRFCHEKEISYFILGKGSNLLIDDGGIDGLVIVMRLLECEVEGERVDVGAGYSFALLGVQLARRGLAGLEFACGIPGSVGGAVYMNAGAGGFETRDVLEEVRYLTFEGELKTYKRDELVFGYRVSPFQKMRGVIVGATFVLQPSETARTLQKELIDYRTRTQPYKEMSAGCIFRNPPGGSAGRLIEQSGLKGARVGGAEVSTLHANFLINRGGTSADMLALIDLVKEKVRAKHGIELELEIKTVKHGPPMDHRWTNDGQPMDAQ